MGNLCPSYDFSFSSLLLKILLLRETDTLSIAAPKRMANCCVGFGLSSCTISTHRESLSLYEEHIEVIWYSVNYIMFSQNATVVYDMLLACERLTWCVW